MFDGLLPTKLYMPPLRSDWVARPRLLTQLTPPRPSKLILISAPAGYGKTTLATTWLRDAQTDPVCWLSLDEDDSNPELFFRYVAAALASLPDVGTLLSDQLKASQLPSPKALMQALVVDVASVSVPFKLVLDDYHAVDSAEIDAALALLLDLMPPHMTLVMTSRSDPGFPLARLRARGQMVELRADDLRFRSAEASQFLHQTMGLTISAEQLAALERRTEGWIAGLQMAALSMQNRSGSELDRFVDSFTGSHRFVLDYLMEEALQQQSPDVADFLLATAHLDRLSAPLCDAITQGSDSRQRLYALDQNNLFLVPLDDQRTWYRYHHLFADMLRAHALAERPSDVATWHQRASDWYAENGFSAEAIRHALAAPDFERAAAEMELIRHRLDGTFEMEMWLGWAAQLPDEIFRQRPVLCMADCWALLETGRLAESEARLNEAIALQDAPSAEMVVVDEDQYRVHAASIASAQSYLALAKGDVVSAVGHAERSVAFFKPGEDHRWRRVALSLLGLTYWVDGDLVAASDAFAAMVESHLRIGKVADAISNAYVLGDMRIELGQLNRAEQGLTKMLRLAQQESDPPPPGSADLYRVLSLIAWQRNDVDSAERLLQTALKLGKAAEITNGWARLCLAQAQFKRAEGDFEGALALIDEAQQAYVENPLPLVQPFAALRAQIWVEQGELGKVAAWAEASQLAVDDELHYLREFEHLVLARWRLAQGRQGADEPALREALDLLARLRISAETGHRNGTLIDVLITEALAHEAAGDLNAALLSLSHALALAEPEGHAQVFLGEGAAMRRLLEATAVAQPDSAQVRQLLALMVARDGDGDSAEMQPLVDPLSDRELEILALVAAGLKNKEIAAQLFISLNTVLYHTKNIYSKLGVNKRALAIAKARELNLIS